MWQALCYYSRYLGDEETAKNEESVTAANLNKLLSKVKERAKSKPLKLNEVTSKIYKLQINGSVSNINQSLEATSETTPKKKKLKKSKSNNPEVELSPSISENLESHAGSSSEILHNGIDKLRVGDDGDEEEKHDFNQDFNDDTAKELFPVIGDFKFKKKKKVSLVFPTVINSVK